MKRKIFLTIFLIITIVACSEPEYVDRSGVIVKKEYVPKTTRMHMRPMWIGKTMQMIPKTEYIPEKYILKVSYVITKEKKIEVSKDEYNRTVIGDKKVFKEVRE